MVHIMLFNAINKILTLMIKNNSSILFYIQVFQIKWTLSSMYWQQDENQISLRIDNERYLVKTDCQRAATCGWYKLSLIKGNKFISPSTPWCNICLNYTIFYITEFSIFQVFSLWFSGLKTYKLLSRKRNQKS